MSCGDFFEHCNFNITRKSLYYITSFFNLKSVLNFCVKLYYLDFLRKFRNIYAQCYFF